MPRIARAILTGYPNKTGSVPIIFDDDSAGYNTLVRLDLSLPRQLLDEKTGGLVDAITGGGIRIPAQTVYVGAKASGEIGGKDGWSGEGTPGNACEFSVRIDSDGKETTPSVNRLGETYTPPAATFSATTIPASGTISMTMNEIYTHATGATGNQTVSIDIRDDDGLGSQLLDQKTVQLARPANCFAGILIGKTASVSSTLSNTSSIVTGPSGSSNEQEAEVYYQIDADQKSSHTSITAQ